MNANPRAVGFNYGIGWGDTPKPPIYKAAMQVAEHLGKIAITASAEAWALEMALRDVRHAETDQAKAVAIARLTSAMRKYRPARNRGRIADALFRGPFHHRRQ